MSWKAAHHQNALQSRMNNDLLLFFLSYGSIWLTTYTCVYNVRWWILERAHIVVKASYEKYIHESFFFSKCVFFLALIFANKKSSQYICAELSTSMSFIIWLLLSLCLLLPSWSSYFSIRCLTKCHTMGKIPIAGYFAVGFA